MDVPDYLVDGDNNTILGNDYLPIETKQYEFVDKDGMSVFIQEHSLAMLRGDRGLILMLGLRIT